MLFMGLTRAIEMDRMGIFSADRESVGGYLERAGMILASAAGANHRYLEARAQTQLQPLDSKTISDAVRNINSRFGVNLSWVGVYEGYLGDLSLESVAAGKCIGVREYRRGGKLTHIEPSFVVVNSSLLFGKKSTAIHELTHFPRLLAFDFSVVYADTQNYEEILARSHSILQMLSPNRGIELLLSPAAWEYYKARLRLQAEFGRYAGYVLMRMTYDEVKDWFIDRGLSPKEAISRSADRGNLRYRIVREVLGF